MAYTKQDYFESDTSGQYFDNGLWVAQTFTASSSYDATRISLKLFRSPGVTGTTTIGLYATLAGKPTGAALAEDTKDTSTLTDSSPGEWYDFDISAVSLTSGTMYAIVGKNSTSGNVNWRNTTPSGYANGTFVASADSGSSWNINTSYDQVFRVYSGSAVDYVDGSGTIAAASSLSGAGEILELVDASGAIAATSVLTATGYVSIFDQLAGKVYLIALGNDQLYYEDLS